MNLNTEEFHIKRLSKNDVLFFQKLIVLFQQVFETEDREIPAEPYLRTLLEKQDFIAYAVMYENRVVAGLTAYVLSLCYSRQAEVFIYDVAVDPRFQRKGLGKKLLSGLKEYCMQNGITQMFVAAHEEDRHAVDFYYSTGGKAEKVVHFNYSLEQ
jgi:aminoglycoside 3-N-acetyltransferase I